MLNQIVSVAPVFVLIMARCLACILVLPLLSSKTAPRKVKVALALYMACFIFPQVSLKSGVYESYASYISSTGSFNLDCVFLIIGEALIGLILGFFVQIIFAAFSTAGQFFAFQMGFTASEVYDSLSQVENPLLGQFLNFVATLCFLQNHWFQKLFLQGLVKSFSSINAFSLVNCSSAFVKFIMSSLTFLFRDALIIALPLMGTLFLINVTVGILSKAAPQMNLLSEGFPILILTAFFVIYLLIPSFYEFFYYTFNNGFKELLKLFAQMGKV